MNKYIQERQLDKLELVVNKREEEGWQPHGNLLYINDWYIQHMVKENEPYKKTPKNRPVKKHNTTKTPD